MEPIQGIEETAETCGVCGEVYEPELPDPDLAVCEDCWRGAHRG